MKVLSNWVNLGVVLSTDFVDDLHRLHSSDPTFKFLVYEVLSTVLNQNFNSL